MPPVPDKPATKRGLPARFFVLDDETGSFSRADIHLTPLVSVDKQILALASSVAQTVPSVGGTCEDPFHLVTSGKQIHMVTRLRSMKLSTHWMARAPLKRGQPPRLVPVFMHTLSPTRMAPLWVPPEDMRVWFVCDYVPQPGAGPYAAPIFETAYLLATCITGEPGTAGIYRLPLPNTHDNAKICMGVDNNAICGEENGRVPLVPSFESALNVFRNNHWNADLLAQHDPALVEAMFCFNADDIKQQLPPPADWAKRCVKINNSNHAVIPFKDLS